MTPPTTTYRLQLRAEFGFRDAASVVPYLADLGVSHVYCSPVLQAAPGSAHGYDVIDHSRLSDELGGPAGWAELVAACDTHGLGLVIDVVPNHMAWPTPERLNPVLWDVLRHGRASAYAAWLDVDWDAQDGKILLPVLGKPLHDALADREVVVDRDAELVRYYDHEFPMAQGTLSLDEQHYRLCHWRVANDALNYRRFFDVTTLMGVRVEQPGVFAATHRTLLDLPGPVDGWRIDHPDGLADPRGYLDDLAAASPGRWVVVEKILEADEQLPTDWACAGTTGYDALNRLTALLVDPAGEQPLTELYTGLTGMPGRLPEVVEPAKRTVATTLFGAEVDRLVEELLAAPEATGRDLTARAVRDAVVELLVALPVYRAYAGAAGSPDLLDAAARTATSRRPDRADAIAWVRRHGMTPRFEQTTGPVMAKGVEDTALYRWHRLVALNEVGGDPSVFGRDVAEWHAWCGRLAVEHPASMTTLSTHDTKRSEDVRARLAVLSELPGEWAEAVTRWRRLVARHRPPDTNTDYLLWQTLVGAWPIPADRLAAYLEKATREAKLQTSWTEPDPAYDDALRRYVERVCADAELVSDVGTWVETHLAGPGLSNSLAQKLLQLTMPGVPDVYQGNELVDLSLVDPDNRRPVDYAERRQALAERSDPKLLVTATAARLRRDRPELVGASYAPLDVTGPAAEHAVAFQRGADVVALATRLPVGLARRGGWGNTAVALPGEGWQDLLTGRWVDGVTLDTLFERLPVALLVR